MGKKPNLVYFFADEFRQRALGFRKEDPIITPNLDSFSKESLEMTNMISNFPVCSPYRGMLFTGTYPWTNGVYTNCNSGTSKEGCYLKAKDICISDVLSENNYDMGYIGKWHLDPVDKENPSPYTTGITWNGEIWDSYTPKERRHNFNFWHAYGCNDDHFHPHYWVNDAKEEERIDVDKWSAEHETDVAVDYISNKNGEFRDKDKPFALFISINPPHMPFNQVPQKYRELYKNVGLDELLNEDNVQHIEKAVNGVADYFAAVSGVDEQFGRVLKVLEENGLTEDTIVIFTSDHGEMMGSHGLMGKNSGYREAVNVPFLMRFPQMKLSGSCDEIVNIPDIFPTLMEMMKLKDEIPKTVEGESFCKAFSGGKTFPYAYYGCHIHSERGVISKEYTYFIRHSFPDVEEEFLFDNINDLFQMKNIAKTNPQKTDELRSILQKMCIEKGDPWVPMREMLKK